VYTAFSGSHQDAIKKGMDALPADYGQWEVPYLPIDPKHVGRTYEAIIRVNSQSGKGGVAYLMDFEHNLDLPRGLQVEFSKTIQAITEATGTEIKPAALWEAFSSDYLAEEANMRLLTSEVSSGEKGTRVTAQVLLDGRHVTIRGDGNGPVDALVNGIRDTLGMQIEVCDYHEHALTAGSEASAAAYVSAKGADGVTLWGVGMHSSILDATLHAVISAANRLRDRNRG
jgi:2-isopropylmalate synthase